MLLSAVIFLKAVRDCRYDHFTGRGTHGFFLKSWRGADPRVGDWLHAKQWHAPLNGSHPPAPLPPNGETIAPYSVSPILGLNDESEIPAGADAWLRVASFHPGLSRCMADGPAAWLANLPERISVDGAEWWLTASTIDPQRHPWAGLSSFESLRHAALDGREPPRTWTVRFETPTAIRGARIAGRDTYLLFPLPDRLLDSWRRCWNMYAQYENPDEPLTIDEALTGQARETLRAVDYRLQTRTVSYQYAADHSSKPRVEVPVTGWTGRVTYESLDVPAVHALEDLLFRFAFYRGTGYHTTQGLGMTRLEPAPVGGADGG